MDNLSESSTKSIHCFSVQFRIPLLRWYVRCNPDFSSLKNARRAFYFNYNGISVKPSEHVGDANTPAKLVDDDMRLARVPIPELGVGVFGIGLETSLVPCSSTLTRTGAPPEDEDLTYLRGGLHVVDPNALNVCITPNKDVGGYARKVSFFRTVQY